MFGSLFCFLLFEQKLLHTMLTFHFVLVTIRTLETFLRQSSPTGQH